MLVSELCGMQWRCRQSPDRFLRLSQLKSLLLVSHEGPDIPGKYLLTLRLTIDRNHLPPGVCLLPAGPGRVQVLLLPAAQPPLPALEAVQAVRPVWLH